MKVQGEALKPARQEALMLAKITYPEVQAQLQAIVSAAAANPLLLD